jgi:carbamoyl-phosphate synthase large subunit
MKSTGEVMGIGRDFGEAFARAHLSAGQGLPTEGTVFVSVNDNDKSDVLAIARDLSEMGYRMLATGGTARYLNKNGIAAAQVAKVGEDTPHIGQIIRAGDVQMVINTPLGERSRFDESAIRREARALDIPCITTLSGGRAAVDGIRALRRGLDTVTSLQDLHRLANLKLFPSRLLGVSLCLWSLSPEIITTGILDRQDAYASVACTP